MLQKTEEKSIGFTDGPLPPESPYRIQVEKAYRIGFLKGARTAVRCFSGELDIDAHSKHLRRLRVSARHKAQLKNGRTVSLLQWQARSRGEHQAFESSINLLFKNQPWARSLDSAGWHDYEHPEILQAFQEWIVRVDDWANADSASSDFYLIGSEFMIVPRVCVPTKFLDDKKRIRVKPKRNRSVQDCINDADGFLKIYIEHNLKTAYRQQPRFALAGALSLVGILAGRKIADEYGTRTNIYSVCVGDSGTGKDHARQLNATLLAEADADHLLSPEELTSDSALINELSRHPAKLLQADEVGRWFATANSARTAHAFLLVSLLLKLYSSAGTKVFKPKGYADSKFNSLISYPHLVLCGTTTPNSFFDALGGASVDDGLISRMFVFQGNDSVGRNRPEIMDLPTDLIQFVKSWSTWNPEAGNLDHGFRIVKASTDADKVLESFADECDKHAAKNPAMRPVWCRAFQKARQLALIFAAGRAMTGENLVVDFVSASWGIDLSRALTFELCTIAETRLSRSEFESRCQMVLRFVKSQKNGIATTKAIGRGIRSLKSKDRNECLNALLEQGLLDHRIGKNGAGEYVS